MQVNIAIAEGQMERALDQLAGISGGVPTAGARAINATLSKGATRARRAITDRYTVKKKDISAGITVRKASARTYADYVEGQIVARGGTLPLIRFQVSPKDPAKRRPRGGTRAKVLRSGSRKVIAHAFTARMRSGHVGVFLRVSGGSVYQSGKTGGRNIRRKFGRGRGRAGADFVGPCIIAGHSGLVARLPVVELRSPSIATMFRKSNPDLRPWLRTELTRKFPDQLGKLLKRGRA